MHKVFLILLMGQLALAASPEDANPPPTFKPAVFRNCTPEELLARFKEKMPEGFNRILVIRADSVIHPKPAGKDPSLGPDSTKEPSPNQVLFAVGTADLDRDFLVNLSFRDDVPQNEGKGDHGCPGDANIEFYKDRKFLMSINFGHGSFWGPFQDLTPDSQAKLSRWFTSKGFSFFEDCRKNGKK